LECCYSGVRDSHLSKWSNLPALQELSLDSCPVSDWSIAHLADNSVVPNLTSLDLADTDLSDHAIRNVTKFKNLKRLSLFFCNITNSSLRHLSTLTSLEVLNLDSREISDTGLVYIVGLPLKSLDIFSGRITDAGCHHISKIKTLECLELCGGTVTDTGCTTIASSLQNLTSLNLSQNERITNRGAAALAALSKLQSLNLSHTSVNSEALIHFSNLRNLQSLAIYGCRGMDHPDGNGMLERLQSGLPNLKCVRINNGTNDDGVLSTSEEDTDEEDFDFDTEQVIFSSAARQGHAGFAAFQFEEHDSDSAMDDAANIAEDDQSDSSYSNHDY
jgi:Leucine rich repeat/Leucine Rich repeat